MKKANKIGISTLLKKNISKSQLAGYFIANLIGLTVILAGILFFCDSRHHRDSTDKYFSDDYIVISKKINGVNLEPISFDGEEIEDLKKEPWVKDLGKFTSADFSVNASVNMGGRGLSTLLFFESVPDEFFDNKPDGWEFMPEKKFVPIILNKDYLALYNFGFALPQGLPQLSEEIIGTVPLKLYLSNKEGKTLMLDANVVGFSSRLNTIAVPQDFMEWANNYFSGQPIQNPSRLILKIDRMDSGNSDQYLKDHGYEIAGDKESESKISEFTGIVSGVVAIIGLVISLLSFFILVLSIFLLIQKSRQMLRNLILLGYSPDQIAKYYEGTVIRLNSLIMLISVGLTFICRLIWQKPLESLGLGNGNVLFMIGAAMLYFIITSIFNILIIRRNLFRLATP